MPCIQYYSKSKSNDESMGDLAFTTTVFRWGDKIDNFNFFAGVSSISGAFRFLLTMMDDSASSSPLSIDTIFYKHTYIL